MSGKVSVRVDRETAERLEALCDAFRSAGIYAGVGQVVRYCILNAEMPALPVTSCGMSDNV